MTNRPSKWPTLYGTCIIFYRGTPVYTKPEGFFSTKWLEWAIIAKSMEMPVSRFGFGWQSGGAGQIRICVKSQSVTSLNRCPPEHYQMCNLLCYLPRSLSSEGWKSCVFTGKWSFLGNVHWSVEHDECCDLSTPLTTMNALGTGTG